MHVFWLFSRVHAVLDAGYGYSWHDAAWSIRLCVCWYTSKPCKYGWTDLELYKCRLWAPAHHTLAYVGIRNQVLNGVLTLPQQLVYLLNSIIETTHVNRPEYKQEERWPSRNTAICRTCSETRSTPIQNATQYLFSYSLIYLFRCEQENSQTQIINQN